MNSISFVEDDDPIELPNGSLICRSHGLTVCGYCCVDYSFADESSEYAEDSGEEFESDIVEVSTQLSAKANVESKIAPSNFSNLPSLYTQVQRGSGRVFATKFNPPSAASTPLNLFMTGIGRRSTIGTYRFVRRNNPDQVLIFADGACLNNGRSNPKGGWAFVFKPDYDPSRGVTSGRLENKGPFGDEAAQTSNRAELRAILGALRFRVWYGEGFTSLVFATDSEYVAEGATSWSRSWVRNGWKTSAGGDVKNRDLWEALLGELERFDKNGLKVQFWRIPRALNGTADRAAKAAAAEEDVDRYTDILGVLT